MGFFTRQTPAQREAARRAESSSLTANEVFCHAWHLLNLIETRFNVRQSRRLATPIRRCNKGEGKHWHATRLEPSIENPRYVMCVVSLDDVTESDRNGMLAQFRSEGFFVDHLEYHPCGCMTFNVHPRRFPA